MNAVDRRVRQSFVSADRLRLGRLPIAMSQTRKRETAGERDDSPEKLSSICPDAREQVAPIVSSREIIIHNKSKRDARREKEQCVIEVKTEKFPPNRDSLFISLWAVCLQLLCIAWPQYRFHRSIRKRNRTQLDSRVGRRRWKCETESDRRSFFFRSVDRFVCV